MDQEIRTEVNALHSRVNDLKERVVKLEAQVPHTNAMLERIEKSVDRINGHIVKAVWLVAIAFGGVVLNFALRGGFQIGG